ncbi:DMT family transporter [Paenibacillus sp. ACRRX]|uniref:DMT family transporter n=1 Tax=Paenibacillus sp. ACRRX TaxID=2918206 RepID=UPI001EF7196A|nr:DMT family transporter [Paenibacillus sp. ACRRX]MCG7407211.1 DMT family transporter [Paenibacillus sp. ACRRX]
MASKKSLHLYICMFIGIIAISFSAIIVKWSEAPASILGMYRLLLTNLLLLPWMWSYREEWKAVRVNDWLRLAASGLFLGIHFLLWMESLRYTSVSSSTVILTLEPVLILIASYWLFQHRIKRSAIYGLGLALIGMVLIGWGDFQLSGQALYGDLLSVLGTIAVVIHMLLGQDLRSRVTSYVYNFSVFLVAGVSLAVYNLCAGIALGGYSSNEWLLFVLMAVIPTVLGHMLFNWLLKYLSATSISMSILGEPVGASLLAWILLGETLGTLQLFACVLLILGVWIFLRNDRPSTASHHAASQPISPQ